MLKTNYTIYPVFLILIILITSNFKLSAQSTLPSQSHDVPSLNTHDLEEVVINNKKRKKITLGTTGYTPLVYTSLSVGNKNSGNYAEQAQLIKIKRPSQLLSVSARVGTYKSKDSITYRLNIYKVEHGLPGAQLVDREITKTFPMTAKLITFNLEQAQLFLEEDFVVAFQYIPNHTSKLPTLSFRASVTGSGAFSKVNNAKEWIRINGGSSAIFVEVEQ